MMAANVESKEIEYDTEKKKEILLSELVGHRLLENKIYLSMFSTINK